MTDQRDMIEAKKARLRREAAEAAQARAVTDQATFEIAFEDVYGKNPNDPILALVLGMLRDGNMDTALQVLADHLGPEKFFAAMARITGQPSDAPSVPALPPVGQPTPPRQPAQLESGHQSAPLAGVIVPDYLDVYDMDGRKLSWAIPRDLPEATANEQGLYRFEVNGTMAYRKRASAPAQAAPAAPPTGPTGTYQQPAARGSWRRRTDR